MKIERKELHNIIWKNVVPRLTERQYHCFLLHFYEKFSTAEIAKHLRISRGDVGKHLERAYDKLRCILEGKIKKGWKWYHHDHIKVSLDRLDRQKMYNGTHPRYSKSFLRNLPVKDQGDLVWTIGIDYTLGKAFYKGLF